jgi:hypothetical protein
MASGATVGSNVCGNVSTRCKTVSLTVVGDGLEDAEEAHQEVVVGHPDRQLMREPVTPPHLTTT